MREKAIKWLAITLIVITLFQMYMILFGKM